jgi:hypothetical protein
MDFIFFPENMLKKLLKSKISEFLGHVAIWGQKFSKMLSLKRICME